MKILVTGATGFMGGAVCRALTDAGHEVTAALRGPGFVPYATVQVAGLGPDTDWRAALSGQEAVVHLAARAHVMDDAEADPLAVFRRVNRDGTLVLARQAAEAGVRRLVFMSSIKVNGEATEPGRPFTAADAPAPQDPYGVSKAEAEAGLKHIPGLETVVIRPPLVHGPGAKGNLARLLALLDKGLPLPLGCIHNARSLVGLDNLASLVAACVAHPDAAGRTFLVKDGEDVSTPELIRRLAAGLGRTALLLPVPVAAFRLAGAVTGKTSAVDRLTGSLVVDDAPTRATLDWTPPKGLSQGLEEMAAAWRRAGKGS